MVTIILLASALSTAAATVTARDDDLRGYVDPLDTANLPFRVPLLGVNAELLQYDAQTLISELDAMRDAGINWVRQYVDWGDVEASPGTFDWQTTDRIITPFREPEQSSLRIVVVFYGTPRWARHEAAIDHPNSPPEDPAKFAAFIVQFTERYGDVVDHYQIWDEPNLESAWGGMPPQPADYAALLLAGYEAIHSSDPSSMVIAAALAPTTEDNTRNRSDITYLRDLYALGLADFSDAVAAKPYGFTMHPEDRTTRADTLNFSRLVLLREVMTEADDGETALWASSWGWNTLPDDWSGEASIWGDVSPVERHAYTLAALARAEREWAWVGGMILENWSPPVASSDPRLGFSLRHIETESLALFDALITRADNSSTLHGIYPPAYPAAQYSGVWTFGALGADIGWVNDSQLSLDFSGNGVGLLLRRGNYSAYLYPTVDNRAGNALPRDGAGNAYISLTSGDTLPEFSVVPIARGLSPGAHQLRVIADRGWDQWALAGFAVSTGDLAAPYNRQISIALLTAFIATLAAGLSARAIDWRAVTYPIRALWRLFSPLGQIFLSVAASVALLISTMLTWNDTIPQIFRREPFLLGAAVSSAGLLYLSPFFLLALIAAALLFVIFYHRANLGLMLVIGFAPFFLFPVALYRFAFPMSELLMLLLAGAWTLRQITHWVEHRQKQKIGTNEDIEQSFMLTQSNWTGFDWGMIAYGILGICAFVWSSYREPVVADLRTLFIEPLLFYLIFRNTARSREIQIKIIDAFLVGGALVCVIGLAQFATGQAIITAEEGTRRLASVYGSPNNVGLYLGRCLPFALTFALLRLNRTRRIFGVGLTLLILITIALTQSAGAIFIGVPVAIIVVIALVGGRRAFLPLVGLGALGAIGAALLLGTARFARFTTITGGTNFFRIRLWGSAWQMIVDHPITGLGLDQFLYAYRGRYLQPDAWQEPNLSHPHNILFDHWLRLGIFGVMLLIALQIIFWRAAWRMYRVLSPNDNLTRALLIGAMGAMANIIFHGLVDNSLFVQDLIYVFVLIWALVGGVTSGSNPNLEHASY